MKKTKKPQTSVHTRPGFCLELNYDGLADTSYVGHAVFGRTTFPPHERSTPGRRYVVQQLNVASKVGRKETVQAICDSMYQIETWDHLKLDVIGIENLQVQRTGAKTYTASGFVLVCSRYPIIREI